MKTDWVVLENGASYPRKKVDAFYNRILAAFRSGLSDAGAVEELAKISKREYPVIDDIALLEVLSWWELVDKEGVIDGIVADVAACSFMGAGKGAYLLPPYRKERLRH